VMTQPRRGWMIYGDSTFKSRNVRNISQKVRNNSRDDLWIYIIRQSSLPPNGFPSGDIFGRPFASNSRPGQISFVNSVGSSPYLQERKNVWAGVSGFAMQLIIASTNI
jgi:hypothetical protein